MKNLTKRLYILRHGETEHNLNGVVQGKETNLPLSKKGIETAHTLARSFDYIDLVLTSPLKRAYQTAQIIASYHGVRVIPIKGLEEADTGLLSGKTFDEFKSMTFDPPYILKDSLTGKDIICTTGKEILDYAFSNDERYLNMLPPGSSETKADVKKRSIDSITKYIDEHPTFKNIIVVTHSGVIKYMTIGNDNFKNLKAINHNEVMTAKYKNKEFILTEVKNLFQK